MEKSLIHTKFTDTLSPDYTTGSQSIKVSCLMFEKKKSNGLSLLEIM